MPTYTATSEDAQQRFDMILSKASETSRSQTQKTIKSGEAMINDRPSKPHTLIQEGDVLSFPASLSKTIEGKVGELPSLNILYEDDDLIVLEKDAGVLVHEIHERDTQQSLADALVAYFPKIKKVGDSPARPGIVHRLDRKVSGVMVAAKTQAAFDHLKQQFKDRTVKKEYLALVYGQLPKDQDTISLKIGRSKSLGRMVARPEDQEGKEAITEYTVIDRYRIATFVNVIIHTGRTHQIRAHFKAIDHPVVGDPLYKKKLIKNIRQLKMDRIFLHSEKLTITLMDGTEKTFVSPLPESLTTILNKLSK